MLPTRSPHHPRTFFEASAKFPAVFEGVDKDYQHTIYVNPRIQPIAQATRRIPLNARRKVEGKLEELQHLNIIETGNGPTPWVSSLVLAPGRSIYAWICVESAQL